MARNSRNNILFLALFVLGIFVFFGCAKGGPSKEIIATVNGEPLYLKDFKKELALRVKQNPSFRITPHTLDEMLDMVINRKLIIQEATSIQLAEEERFINTIKAFWEQTLIRDFIDYKNRETERLLDVRDSEIKDYYEKLKTRATFNIVKRTRKQDIEALMQEIKDGGGIEWDTTVSLSYEEIPSAILAKAFDLAPGQMGIFEEGYMHYLVYVVAKEPISIPSFKEAYPRIKKKIKQRKQQQALSEWLKDKKDKSDIEINTDILREANK